MKKWNNPCLENVNLSCTKFTCVVGTPSGNNNECKNNGGIAYNSKCPYFIPHPNGNPAKAAGTCSYTVNGEGENGGFGDNTGSGL